MSYDTPPYKYVDASIKERKLVTLEEAMKKMIVDDMEALPESDALTETQQAITTLMHNFMGFLIEKNRLYGDSALTPVRIFSKGSSEDQLLTRLDDKANRIMNSDELRKNDVADMMGYLVLLMVSRDWTTFTEFLD